MGQMLIAAFKDKEGADQAYYELEHFGYEPVEIMTLDRGGAYESRDQVLVQSMLSGLLTGAALGVIAGVLAGTGLVPALSNLFFTNPVVSSLGLKGLAGQIISGLLSGAIAGGVIGLVAGYLLPRQPEAAFQRIADSGGSIIGLADHDQITTEAQAILERHGAGSVQMVQADTVARPVRKDSRSTNDVARQRQAGAAQRPHGTQQPQKPQQQPPGPAYSRGEQSFRQSRDETVFGERYPTGSTSSDERANGQYPRSTSQYPRNGRNKDPDIREPEVKDIRRPEDRR
jgi:hypothetical protein